MPAMSESATRPQAVYFDSNILIAAGWPFPSAQFLQLVRKAREADLDVCLPELVLREITEHWLRDITTRRQRLADQIKAYNREALGLSTVTEPSLLPAADELRSALTKLTKEILDQFRLVPTADRPASYYSELALKRHGAFAEKGKGFHDTIILCGLLEDMAERKYSRAILVSTDNGFRADGVRHLTDRAKVQFTVIDSLNALEKLLSEELSAKITRIIQEGKRRVIEMVKRCEPQLIDFLSKVVDYTRGPLDPLFGTVSRREFLSLAGYDDSHASDILFEPGLRKGYKFSVDVRVAVRERLEEFRATDPISSFAFSGSFHVVHPENITSKTVEREMALTVEGEADISAKGVEVVRFTEVHDTKPGRGFSALIS